MAGMRRAGRHHVVRLCAFVLALLICPHVDAAAARGFSPGPGNARNILFVIMDDVGIDQMRIFGYDADDQPRTPNIDAVARAGVRFRNAWAMPECSPSRVSFFTGRFPLRTGVVSIVVSRDLANSQMSPFEVTTPKVLRERGYASALFGKWHLTEVATNDPDGNPNPGNPMGNAAPRDLGWNFYFGDLEGAPRAIDTTAGGVAPAGTYSCGFVNNASFGACYSPGGSCTPIGQPGDPPGPRPGLTCLQQGGILVPNAACQSTVPAGVNFTLFNGYYVAPLVINHQDGGVELVAGFDDHGQTKPPLDPLARQYLTTQQTNAALAWITQQPPQTPWMATVSYSAAHLPVQPPPRSLLPADAVDSSGFNCSGKGSDQNIADLRTLFTQTVEAMDTEFGRLLVSLGLARRNPDGSLNYRPEQTNTMIVIVGDNGSYFNTVRAPFDPERAKGTVYQTGVWVPLIVAGPRVAPEKVGTEVTQMVNAAVDVFSLFGEIADIDVRAAVPPSHVLDARPLLPYVTGQPQPSIRKENFTQVGTNLKAPDSIVPCVLKIGSSNVCTEVFPFADLCETEGGTPQPNAKNCCQVQEQEQTQDPPVTITVLPEASWSVRDDRFKLVRQQTRNCTTGQLDLSYEFYIVNEDPVAPRLDRAADNLLTSSTLPPKGLSPEQRVHFDALLAALVAIQRSESDCPGDGNLDKSVDEADIANWMSFAQQCAENPNHCSSVYDLNHDVVTDSADFLIIEANFGRVCTPIVVRP